MITIEHGIEYYIILQNSIDTILDIMADLYLHFPDIKVIYTTKVFLKQKRDIFCIVDTKRADIRLLCSSYYNNKKDTWWDGKYPHEPLLPSIKQIRPEYLADIELTRNETTIIIDLLNRPIIFENVLCYGWFDVVKHI
jgi:hypothetical protein